MKRILLLTLCLWIASNGFSQGVITRDSLLCIDRVTGSKIVKDLVYLENLSKLKSDTISTQKVIIDKQNSSLKDKSRKILNRNLIILVKTP